MHRVTQIKKSFTYDATATTAADAVIDETGWVRYITFTSPNVNSITATLSVLDRDGNTVWSKASVTADNGTVLIQGTDLNSGMRFPIGENFKLKCVLSGAAGGTGGTFYVSLYK